MSGRGQEGSVPAAGAPAKKRGLGFAIALAVGLLLPLLGKGGMLAGALLLSALFGVPLFVLIGILTILCFLLWGEGIEGLGSFSPLIERIRELTDKPVLLAVPLFIMSGAVMAKGEISKRLIDFSRSLVGWIPGGEAISAVVACMLFASISGSSPATVVAIGAMMGPTLIQHGFQKRFTHGLLTASGSLGILIPPSIPMILYPLVYQGAFIEVERLFASGFGPGLLIGGILISFCVYRGVVDGVPRQPFRLANLWIATRDGFWALMFPAVILGGIYGGIFNAVEAAAISVVYAVVVEIWVHRAIELRAVPTIFHETGVFLGSLLVIMVVALAFTEFLEMREIPREMVEWIQGMELEPWQFLLALNVLLLMVGMAMDIISAMFVFVPLLAPVAISMGVDPMHFGIIFIVNLEIGYLTPPVGLNLFVASTLFDESFGHMARSVLPFIVAMLIGLGMISYLPEISIGLADVIMGPRPGMDTAAAPLEPRPLEPEDGPEDPAEEAAGSGSGMQSMEEMMREAAEGGEPGAEPVDEPEPSDPGRMQTLEEMMREANGP
ncbi:MAG: TRAP transporter large permease [Myxococcales bacterium]|nr:TRAP transporter large permease [Myxococcales bacterium]